jgi:hypothetical protein
LHHRLPRIGVRRQCAERVRIRAGVSSRISSWTKQHFNFELKFKNQQHASKPSLVSLLFNSRALHNICRIFIYGFFTLGCMLIGFFMNSHHGIATARHLFGRRLVFVNESMEVHFEFVRPSDTVGAVSNGRGCTTIVTSHEQRAR